MIEFKHFDQTELIEAVIFRTQQSIKDLGYMDNSGRIKELIWDLYPFISDLYRIPQTVYKVKDGYITVSYPQTVDELFKFNKEPAIYFYVSTEPKIVYTETIPQGYEPHTLNSSYFKLLTRIYLGEENIGYPTMAESDIDFPILGPLRLVTKGLEDVFYALYTYGFCGSKLEHKNQGTAPSMLKRDPGKPDYHIMAYLESIRLATILSQKPEPGVARDLLAKWFNKPRFPIYDRVTTTVKGISLNYPFDQRALIALYDHKVDHLAELNVKFNGQPIQPEEATQIVSASPDTHSEGVAKKVPQMLLLKEINVLRDKLGMPPLKARWSLHGDIVDFEE